MNNIEKIDIQFNKALELKKDSKYAAALKTELSKPEWKEELSAITERLANLGSKSDFDRCFKQLVGLFDQIYEKITAPGLDAFISWIEEHTKNCDENIKKLKEFLKKDYESYSSSIDEILSSIAELPQEDEKHLFDTMISDFNKKLKKDVSAFVNAPDKFENAIQGFLSTLSEEYSNMCSISELSYTDITELYTDEQKKKANIVFYERLIKKAISSGQNLKELDDSEKNASLSSRSKKRIASIRKCIDLFIKTDIASSEDEELQYLFLRFEKDMLDTTGDISVFLDDYLTKKWVPLQDNYCAIKEFHEESTKQFQETEWKGFDKEADITALVTEYNSVKSANILPSLRAYKLEELTGKINGSAKKISDLQKKEDATGKLLVEFFNEIIDTYNNKKQLLDKLVGSHPELKSLYEKIYSQDKCMATLTDGVSEIQTGSLLELLSEGTIYDMISDMNTIKSNFLEILKKSQLEEQIDWLNSLNSTEIGTNEFKSEYILELVRNGLITLSFKKEF